MSNIDISGLVVRLREREAKQRSNAESARRDSAYHSQFLATAQVYAEAADALERLEKERDAAQAIADSAQEMIAEVGRERDKARAKIDGLEALLPVSKAQCVRLQTERDEAIDDATEMGLRLAEAERERDEALKNVERLALHEDIALVEGEGSNEDDGACTICTRPYDRTEHNAGAGVCAPCNIRIAREDHDYFVSRASTPETVDGVISVEGEDDDG